MAKVADLRKILVSAGLSVEEAENIKGKRNLMDKVEELNVTHLVEAVDEEDMVVFDEESNGDENVVDVDQDEKIPLPTSPDWHDWVMSQFTGDELISGKPVVDGLRRVAEKVIGPIVFAKARCVQAPVRTNDNHATVEHTVGFATEWGVKEFCDVADVDFKNTPMEYANHATATASTKAESRALRKALKLKKMITHEESLMEEVDPALIDTMNMKWDPHLKINNAQKAAIDNLCKKLDINVWKFINSGSETYADINDVRHSTAKDMIELLNKYQNHEDKEPPVQVRKYVSGWESSNE